MVLTTFRVFIFLYNFQHLAKKQESYWPLHFSHFYTTPKSPKFTSTKFSCFVAPTFSHERCRKSQFRHSHAAWESLFFLIRTQRGSAIFIVDDTSPARRRFFFIFSTPPQRELQKSIKAHIETMVWTCRRGRRNSQIGSKSSPSSQDYDRDAFLEWSKI